jgi:hypothetical protein
MSEADAAPPPEPPIFRPPPPPLPAAAPAAAPQVEPPSADVAAAASDAGMPGAHRGGFGRLPTVPIGVAEPVHEDAPPAVWAAGEASAPARGIAGWALVFGIAGLAFSLFVGWGFPIGIVAIVLGVIALRRPIESRAAAAWAICLGAVSVLYSAGWLLWAATRTDLLG